MRVRGARKPQFELNVLFEKDSFTMANQYVTFSFLVEELDIHDEARHSKWRLIYDMESVPQVCSAIRTN